MRTALPIVFLQVTGMVLAVAPATFGQSAHWGSVGPEVADPFTHAAPRAGDDSLAVNPFTGQTSVSASNYTPLTGQQIWNLYFRQTYTTVGAYFGPAFVAVVDQATSRPSQWRGGLGGFGKRLASEVASDDVIENSFQFPMSVLLREDVRYISSGPQGAAGRLAHALLFSFLTYNYRGRPTLNVAGISSNYFAAALSTYWLPGSHRTVDYTFVNGSEGLLAGLPVNVVQEFWPQITELSRKLLRRN